MKANRYLILAALLLLTICSGDGAFCQEAEETRLYTEANSYTMQGKWKEAVDVFSKLLARYPGTRYTDSRFWIGYSLVEMGKFSQGLNYLDNYARTYPASGYAPQALYRMGEVYEKKLQDYDRALKAYDRIVNSYPGDNAAPAAAQNQAVIYSQRKMDYDKAMESFKTSKSLAVKQGISVKSEYVARADRRICFIRENSDYAFEPLKLYSAGFNKEEESRHNEAVGIYDVLLKKYPDAKIADDASFRLIHCLMRLGRTPKAKAKAMEFLSRYPSSPYLEKVRAIIIQLDKKQGEFDFKGPTYFV